MRIKPKTSSAYHGLRCSTATMGQLYGTSRSGRGRPCYYSTTTEKLSMQRASGEQDYDLGEYLHPPCTPTILLHHSPSCSPTRLRMKDNSVHRSGESGGIRNQRVTSPPGYAGRSPTQTGPIQNLPCHKRATSYLREPARRSTGATLTVHARSIFFARP